VFFRIISFYTTFNRYNTFNLTFYREIILRNNGKEFEKSDLGIYVLRETTET